MCKASKFYLIDKVLDLLKKVMESREKVLEFLIQCILEFHTIPRDTKDNSRSGHVGVPNKRNNQNSFVKSTPTWPP